MYGWGVEVIIYSLNRITNEPKHNKTMTREEFDLKLDSLLEDVDFKSEMKERINKVFSQGAVDLSSYEDNFRLPKAMLFCAIESFAWQYKPLDWDKELAKEIKNIKYFIA
jgi:hypothetical protein